MLSLLLQSAKAVDMCKNRIGSGYRVQVEVVSRTFETLLTNNAEYWLSYALRQQFDEEIEVILVPLVHPSVTKRLRNEINDILCMLNFS
jgi:hypothetical protein